MDNNSNWESYSNLRKRFDAIMTNKELIADELSNFVINGKPIGSDVYGYGYDNIATNDIHLPDDISEYQALIRQINEDIDAIDALRKDCNRLVEMNDSTKPNSYTSDQITFLKNMANSVGTMSEARGEVRDTLTSVTNRLPGIVTDMQRSREATSGSSPKNNYPDPEEEMLDDDLSDFTEEEESVIAAESAATSAAVTELMTEAAEAQSNIQFTEEYTGSNYNIEATLKQGKSPTKSSTFITFA